MLCVFRKRNANTTGPPFMLHCLTRYLPACLFTFSLCLFGCRAALLPVYVSRLPYLYIASARLHPLTPAQWWHAGVPQPPAVQL